MNEDIVYRINANDEIVYVNEAWDRFARDNAAEHLVSNRILNRPIWDFVKGLTTEQLYRDMLDKVRQDRVICFPLRCDAPDRRRLLQMTLSVHEKREVEFRSRTLSTEVRPTIPASNSMNALESLVMCGWCKRLDVAGNWVEIEAALVRLGLFEASMLPAISHSICLDCDQAMRAMLAPE